MPKGVYPRKVNPLHCQGVYMIKNTHNGKVYIGSSVDIFLRFARHKNDLRLNRHSSIILQRAYNKYGLESFEFSVIETVADHTQIHVREQYWMDHYQSYNLSKGYNRSATARKASGYRLTNEQRVKVSAGLKDHWCTWGRKLTDNQVIDLIKDYVHNTPTHQELADKYDVSRGTVQDILLRRVYRNVVISCDLELELKSTLDRNRKRKAIGNRNKNAKLTESDIPIIKQRRASGETYQAIASDYDVTKRAIIAIVKGLNWSHVS